MLDRVIKFLIKLVYYVRILRVIEGYQSYSDYLIIRVYIGRNLQEQREIKGVSVLFDIKSYIDVVYLNIEIMIVGYSVICDIFRFRFFFVFV